jgi:iron(III) transport system substrate-binding protein
VPASTSIAATAAQAPAAAQAWPGADKLKALVEDARKEGQLALVWGNNTAGGAEAAQQWIEGFNKLYGLNVNVRFTPGPSMPDMATKIIQEFQAQRPSTSDVMIGSEAHIVALMQAGALEPVDWASWAPNIQDKQLFATPDGIAVTMGSRTPGITYNTKKVAPAEVPKTMADLLKPEYKGRIASTPYAAMFDRLASSEMWGEPRTFEYVTKLSQQVGGLLRCGEMERIVSGEFDVFALDCGNYDVLKWQEKGAPVAHVVPTDAATIVYWYMGVPKNATHPAAAKLFINYVLGREGQEILNKTDRTDLHLIKGSRTGETVDRLRATGATVSTVDVEFVLRNDDKQLDRIRTQLQDILQRKK